MSSVNTLVLTIVTVFLHAVQGDYPCVCNYNVEKALYPSKSEQVQPIGYMYEFDCKAQLGTEDGSWLMVAFEHQVGYVSKDGQIMVQVCAGNPPSEDLVTTTQAPATTTSMTSTTTEPTSQAISTISTLVTTEASTLTSTQSRPPTVSTTQVGTSSTFTTMWSSTTAKTATTSYSPSKSTTLHTRTIPSKVTPSTTLTTVSASSTESFTSRSPSTAVSTQQSMSTSTKTTDKPTTVITSTQQTMSASTQTTDIPTTVTTVKSIQTTKGSMLSCSELLKDIVSKDNGTLFAYGDKCLELLRIHTTWVNAELECRRKGGHLAGIDDSSEQRVIFQVIETYYHESVWIGLHDMHHEENFEWTSGKPVIYTNWYPGRKDPNLHWTEDCVAMALNKYYGRWEDRNCSEIRGFVCQFEKRKMNPPAMIG